MDFSEVLIFFLLRPKHHELRALMFVLRHNLKIIGSPLIGNLLSYNECDYLAMHMISFVDPFGNTFLMPCKDPAHNVNGTNVYENEYKHHMLKGLQKEK